MRYVMRRGDSVRSAFHSSCSLWIGPGSGTRISRTMSVIAIAKTPSLNAAMRSRLRPATWLYDLINCVLRYGRHSSDGGFRDNEGMQLGRPWLALARARR